MIKRSPIYLLLYLAIVVCVGWLFTKLPSSFLPAEDQGYFFSFISLPVGSSQEHTVSVLKKMEDFYFKQPEVEDVIDVAGFSFAGQGQNSAIAFVHLKPWPERPGAQHSADAVIGRAFGGLSAIPDGFIFPVNPPPIPELGVVAGFDMELEDQGGLGHDKLMDARRQLFALAATNSVVQGLQMQALEDTPELQIDVDQTKASALGVSLADLNTTLTTYFGSYYINNFIDGNRVQHVVAQLDAPYRMLPEDIGKAYVQANGTNMAPLSEVVKTRWTYASPSLQHYNGFPALELTGSAKAGLSTSQAMKAMEELVKQLPKGIGYEWTGQSYEELLSSEQAPLLLSISILVVFLALAALYESWSIPIAVVLVIPLGVLGALLGAHLRGLPNDVFFKVGLLTIIGLSAKNAILIVEFAKDMQAEGMPLIQATLTGARLRLRPILMTSLAFILGVMPMAVSTGAGAASRHDMGTGVIGGMISATLLAIFMVPVFYVLVRRIFKGKTPNAPVPPAGAGGKNENTAKP